jgi:hypothetical protein
MIENRRHHPRYAVQLDCEIRMGHEVVRGRSKNISQSGIACIVPNRIPVSEAVTMSIALVFGENAFSEPLVLPATIVWCTPVSDSYQIGAKFADVSPQLRSFVDLFAQYLAG